ncbi:MAG: carbohydrate binding family 9 domain-containing protein [Bacteroidetes bacterium]|nr:carbohydrate binding family 9 domain-containing protein [Bacteroidota bacterium]
MKSTLFLIFSLPFLVFNAYAQEKTYSAKRIQNPPRIDGLFDDEAWQEKDWGGDFIQFQPENGKAPSQKTEFVVTYDDDNIYVALKAYDTESDKIERRLTRRDGFEGDLLGVSFDSYFDQRTSFNFIVNAAGVKSDGIFTGDSSDDEDDTWDPIWDVKTKIHGDGWNAEMKIPLSQLRFGEKQQQVWGFNVMRNLFRKDEWNLWQNIPLDASGWVSLYGKLDGIDNIKPKKQLEIAPFIVGKTEFYEEEEGNPFADGNDWGMDAGVDGKIGLTNDLILDFAINPDFGQVEADPSEVNLSAFESYFQEKRPFFIEGNNITNFQMTPGNSPWSSDNLFYSRRIGKNPSYYPDLADEEYVDMPDNARILGAFKVTGKTKNGWSVGIIESLTNEEKALIDNKGTRRKETVEPFTNYFVSRLSKDINKGNTIIGGMFTSTNRSIKSEHLEFLPSSAISGGIDFTQYFKDRKYILSLHLVASQLRGSKEAIWEQQHSSIRYFQRPDADYLTLDPEATTLSGTGGNILFQKNANTGFRYMFNTTWRSPGLELNDVGFLRRGNTIFQFLWAGYSIDKPFSIFRSVSFNANQWSGWDFGANNLFNGGNISMSTEFKNFWSFGMGINREGESRSNTFLRGGPSFFSPGNWNVFARVGTNSRKKLRMFGGMFLNFEDHNASKSIGIFGDIIYRPSDRLSFSVEPELSVYKTKLQYVTEEEFEDEPRYIFGDMDQKTFSVTLRLDYNITPDLTIQYYGSPFVSGGLYSAYKRITDPKANDFSNRYHAFHNNEISYFPTDELYYIDEQASGSMDYSFEKPDFNFRQFQSNLVLRWEYVPGSVLYAVWSQGRTDVVSDGEFDFTNDVKSLFKVTPRDIFLIKLSYRFRAEQWFK